MGNFGDISTFSFYGNKTITTGEGGMVVTKKFFLYKRIIKFKSQGLNIFKKNNFYNHEVVGYNYRMTNMQAAVGVAQMEQFENFYKIRENNALLYFNNLKPCVENAATRVTTLNGIAHAKKIIVVFSKSLPLKS